MEDDSQDGTATWADQQPFLRTDGANIILYYKFKVSSPLIPFTSGGDTTNIFTTRQVNEFYIECTMSDSISITTTDIDIETPDLGAAGNGAGTAIDTSALFTLTTFIDNARQTPETSFELGSPVYTKIDGAGILSLPTDIIWAANECTANDDNGESLPIYASDGLCINPYLDVNVANAVSNSNAVFRDFEFDAFTFDTNLVADTMKIVSKTLRLL